MKLKFIQAYMDTATRFAELSQARRLHVGAIVVKDDRIISIGYNGMPSGWDNNCEDTVFVLHEEVMGTDMNSLGYTQTDKGNWTKLKSKPEVLHAETNAIAKLARSNESGLGSDMFITHSPCLDCAKLIYQAGIKRVYFGSAYRSNDGVDFLKKSGVEVEQVVANLG
jgi:dCMP deaminase